MMKTSIKKMIMAGLATVLVCSAVALAGCGSDSAATGTNNSKKVIAVTNAVWNPFEYLENGKVVGFDIDLFNAVAKEAGYESEVKNVGWEAMFQQIKDKNANLAISGITITDERKQTYNFSIPYFISKEVILVPDTSSVASAEDLKGKTVAVQNATTAQKEVEKVLGANNPNVKKATKTMRDQMLLTGQVDAIVGDEVALGALMKEHPEKHFKVVYDDKAFAPEYFGMMYAKDGNKKMMEDFNNALKKVVDSGKYAEIYKKWFQKDPDMNALKAALNK